MSRRERRGGFDDHQRVMLLEDDMDDAQQSIGGVKRTLSQLNSRIGKLVLTLATTAVLLAADVIVRVATR